MIVWLHGPARADDAPRQIYADALRASREGDPAAAVEMLWGIVKGHPEHSLADDALFEIASLQETRLGDFEAARKTYELLIQRYPNTKPAMRARSRLERLAESRKTGDEPLRIFNEVRNRYAELGSDRSLEMMRELYRDYPTFGKRDHVLFWIAEELHRRKAYREALERYRELLRTYPDSQWAYFTTARMGKVYIELRDFDAAIATFEGLARFEDAHPGARAAAAEQIRTVHRFRLLRHLFFLSLGIALAAVCLWASGTRWGSLGRREVVGALVDVAILAPVMAVCLWFARHSPGNYRTALLGTWGVLSAAAFLNHLYVRSREYTALRRLWVTLGALVAVSAMVYAVYYQADMINLLYDSFQYD